MRQSTAGTLDQGKMLMIKDAICPSFQHDAIRTEKPYGKDAKKRLDRSAII